MVVGRALFFRQALIREPVPEFARYTRAGGPHKGIRPPNIPDEIWTVVRNKEDPLPTLRALENEIDLAGLYDLIEIDAAQTSWDHADAFNADWRHPGSG